MKKILRYMSFISLVCLISAAQILPSQDLGLYRSEVIDKQEDIWSYYPIPAFKENFWIVSRDLDNVEISNISEKDNTGFVTVDGITSETEGQQTIIVRNQTGNILGCAITDSSNKFSIEVNIGSDEFLASLTTYELKILELVVIKN